MNYFLREVSKEKPPTVSRPQIPEVPMEVSPRKNGEREKAPDKTGQVCASGQTVIARSDSDDLSAVAQRAKAAAIHFSAGGAVEYFADPVIGRAFARPVGSQ